MIKVIANSTEQAMEIIQAFENSDAKIVIDIKENTTTENSDNSFILPKQKLETLKIDLENKVYEINGINLSNMRVSHIKYDICGIEHSIEITFEDLLGNKFIQEFNNFI